MPIKSWFSTPIYMEKLLTRGLSRFNTEIEEQCYLVRDTDSDGDEWSSEHYLHGYTSYGSITDLHRRYPHFEELSQAIDRHVRRFSRHLDWDLQGGRLEMSSCWVNIMPTHTAHSLHLHPLSVISGTYYVSVPKGASSIKFEDPRLSKFMAAPPKKAQPRPRNQSFVTLEPRDGHVALWESWLRHEVPPNRSRGDRISISFNYDWV
jgi:uncharacterized protein (TIGR02466 family)